MTDKPRTVYNEHTKGRCDKRSARIGFSSNKENRHRAGWRFVLLTVNVIVYLPICNVSVIGIRLTPFRGAWPTACRLQRPGAKHRKQDTIQCHKMQRPTEFALRGVHFSRKLLDQLKDDRLLFLAQTVPAVQKPLLGRGQRHCLAVLRE